MQYKYLYNVLPFLKRCKRETQKQFEEYFKSAPAWIMDSFQIEEMDKGEVFVRENTPIDTIYFVGKGTIKATDYRIYGITYDFMSFDCVHALGGMEIIMDLDTYMTTLETATPCTIVKIPKAQYEKWLLSDLRVLKLEAKLTGKSLLEDGRKSRAYLFLQGSDRLAMLLTERYELYAKNGLLRVQGGRQGLSDTTGLCVKTINRAVKKFSEEGLISKEGNKIAVSYEQYRKLKDMIMTLIDIE